MQIELSNLSFFYAMRLAQSSTYNYPENRLYSICFLRLFREFSKLLGEHWWWNHYLVKWQDISTFHKFVENSITCWKVPLLKISRNFLLTGVASLQVARQLKTNSWQDFLKVFWKCQKAHRNSSISEFFINCTPIFTNSLQPCLFFKLWKIPEIISVVKFFLAEVGANKFSEEELPNTAFWKTYKGLQVDLKRTSPRMTYWEVSKNF